MGLPTTIKESSELTIKVKRLTDSEYRLCLYPKRKLIEDKIVSAYKPFDILKKLEFILKYHKTSRDLIC